MGHILEPSDARVGVLRLRAQVHQCARSSNEAIFPLSQNRSFSKSVEQ